MTTPSQINVWHDVFAQSPSSVLLKLLAEDMVPSPCVLNEGQDLLLTLLSRSAPEALLYGFGSTPMKKDPRLASLLGMGSFHHTWEDRLNFQTVAIALLDRNDVQAWPSKVAPTDARAVDLAVENNLVAVVEYLFQRLGEE